MVPRNRWSTVDRDLPHLTRHAFQVRVQDLDEYTLDGDLSDLIPAHFSSTGSRWIYPRSRSVWSHNDIPGTRYFLRSRWSILIVLGPICLVLSPPPKLTCGCFLPIRTRSSLRSFVTRGEAACTLAISWGTTPSQVSTPHACSPRDISRFTYRRDRRIGRSTRQKGRPTHTDGEVGKKERERASKQTDRERV